MGPTLASGLVFPVNSDYRILSQRELSALDRDASWSNCMPCKGLEGETRPSSYKCEVSPLWALFQGYLALGGVAGEIFLLLILGPSGSGY